MDLTGQIEKLTQQIESNPNDAELYMARAVSYYRIGSSANALNDFIMVTRLDPSNYEAQEYATMIKEIFEYRYIDIYNP